ncbi:MAG: DUF87 domain-containing protein [Nitrososphaera sp.]|jgi:hypothetical protein
MSWMCFCGNLVDGKRFCPRCKHVRFRLDRPEFLDYFGPSIGTVTGGYAFNFPVNYLEGHTMICGQTGTGKSRFAMNLAVKMENQKLRLLVIDVEGEWKGIIPFLKDKTEYYDVGRNLRVNPFDLKDPGLIRELMRETVFKGIEKEYVDLSAQMNFVLQDAIAESQNMEELVSKIKSYSKQKLTGLDKTKTALLVRLDPFMRSPLKEIFFCKKSNPDLEKLADRNVVIDLHSLDARVAYGNELRLIYNTITTYYLRSMLAREPTSVVSNLFVADEAQLLVPRILQKIVVTESWPATEFATRLRKRGCGLVLITQSPSNIEKDIFKNTATKIAFRLQSQEDIKLIADSAGFSDITEYEFLAENLVNLGRKQAIVFTEGKEPFLVTADDFEPSEQQFQIAEMPSASESSEPLEDLERLVGVLQRLREDIDSLSREADSQLPESVSEMERAFLESIAREPFISRTERKDRLGFNSATYSMVVDSLIEKGVVEKYEVFIGAGRPVVLYQRKGQIPSVKHEFYVDYLARHLASLGLQCVKQKVGPDIVIPSLNTAINVELGTSDIQGNIAKAISQYSRVIVCSDDAELLKSLPSNDKVLASLVWDVPELFKGGKDKGN